MRFVTICLLALLAFVAVIRASDGSDNYEEDDGPRTIGSFNCESTSFELELGEDNSGSRKRSGGDSTETGTETETETGEDGDDEETKLHFKIDFSDSGSVVVYEAESEGSVSGVSTESKVRVKFTGAGVYDVDASTGVATLATDCSVSEWNIACPGSEPTGDFTFDVTSVTPAGFVLSNSFVTATNVDGQTPSQAEVLVSANFADLCAGATLGANQFYGISVEIVSASEQDDEEGSDESAVVAGQTLFKWAATDSAGSEIVKYTSSASSAASESDDDDFSSSNSVVFCPQNADGSPANSISEWDPTIQVDKSGAAALVASLLALLL